MHLLFLLTRVFSQLFKRLVPAHQSGFRLNVTYFERLFQTLLSKVNNISQPAFLHHIPFRMLFFNTLSFFVTVWVIYFLLIYYFPLEEFKHQEDRHFVLFTKVSKSSAWPMTAFHIHLLNYMNGQNLSGQNTENKRGDQRSFFFSSQPE